MRHRAFCVLIVGLVTRITGSIGDVVVVVDVAIRAGPGRYGVRTGQRPSCLRVIELAIGPLHGVMALLAGSREPGMRDRAFCVLIIGLVTRDTGRDRNVVVVIDVAVG